MMKSIIVLSLAFVLLYLIGGPEKRNRWVHGPVSAPVQSLNFLYYHIILMLH